MLSVLSEMNRQISVIQSAWYLQPKHVLVALNALKRKIFASKVEAIGFDVKADEDILTTLKRVLVISAAAKAGDKQYLTSNDY
jgi:hypothetical protein